MPDIGGLFYEEHGPADGPPLILSSGLGGSAGYWAPNLPALAAGHRVIAYDHRGTGRSDRALPPGLTVDIMADDVVALMDGLGLERATLIGHAAGGAIGLAIALSAPERLDRLVVVNGFSRPDPHFVRCMEIRLALLRDSGVEAFIRAQPIFLYPARWISENSERLDAEEAGHIEQFQGSANVEARIAALLAFDIDDRLAEIATPTLMIAAEDDMLVPDSCSDRLVEALPNAGLQLMLGGHACNVSEPAVFDKILGAWLAGAPEEGVQ
ncbi:MAG TPA: pyrimidine utilization protein D [Allosphingosinicella sp.]|jgi:aminoacrylate hydrolase|nr:pyrimidine utilization protein D [Allosphingosinicella sp.]